MELKRVGRGKRALPSGLEGHLILREEGARQVVSAFEHSRGRRSVRHARAINHPRRRRKVDVAEADLEATAASGSAVKRHALASRRKAHLIFRGSQRQRKLPIVGLEVGDVEGQVDGHRLELR